MKTQTKWSILTLIIALTGCASSPVSVTTEHHKGVTIVHHRQRVGNGSVDKIDAIAANGTVTQAEVHVYDLGRYVDGSGNVHEAHRLYRTVQSERPNLLLPKTVSAGPRSVYTPPNYSPPPQDQRINDAVDEAKQAANKLKQAEIDVQKRLAADNSLKGELQDQIDQNQQLRDQLAASMNTPRKDTPAPETDAQKAAESATTQSDLQKWGNQQVGNQQ